jgi:hypothetical protein
MIKYYCDACNKEVKRLNSWGYLCHIDDYFTHKMGYVDNEGNSVSGREISVDLCNECYNKIVIKAVEELNNIRAEHINKEEHVIPKHYIKKQA